MTALPKWLNRITENGNRDFGNIPCQDNEAEILIEALATAWEALEYAAEDRTEHLQNLTWVGQTAKEAMRRIAELGKE